MLWKKIKNMIGHRTVEDTRNENTETEIVTITAETAAPVFRPGEEIRLTEKNGTYMLVNEADAAVPAQVYANVTGKTAERLARVKACFTVRKIHGNILKAVMNNPYALVHHAEGKWVFLHG